MARAKLTERSKAVNAINNSIYREKHKERLKEIQRQRYINKREELLNKQKEYKDANKERLYAVNRLYYKNNKHDIIKRTKEWYQENRERILQRAKEYQKINPEIPLRNNHKRRARIAGNGGSYEIEELTAKFNELGNVCYYCGIPGKMVIEHMTPISRGGTNNIDNIVPACSSCNSRKHSKTAAEFFATFTDEDITKHLVAIAEYKYTH